MERDKSPLHSSGIVDFMLEEELVDSLTECLQKPSKDCENRITDIGRRIFEDGGLDAMENFFFAAGNRVSGEIGMDPAPLRRLWVGIDPGWKA